MEEKKKSGKTEKKFFAACLFSTAAGVLMVCAGKVPGFAEWYAVHIYRYLTAFYGRVSGAAPFSIAEFGLYVLLAWILISGGCMAARMIRADRETKGSLAFQWVSGLFLTVYRFMKMIQINWIRFTTLLASRIIKDAIVPLDSKDRANVLIIDDSMFDRNSSKKVELLAKVYDHANHRYRSGFRLLTLGWSDGSTFLPLSGILLSSENKRNRVNEAADVDKRTVGYRRRMLSMKKGTQAMLELLKSAKKADIPAGHVLFDSWFSSPSTLHAVKTIGYDVIGMVKKTPKMFFRHDGADMPLTAIYKQNKKRRGRSRYLLSVLVDVVKDGKTIPAKVVYVRNRSKRKEYLCLISTDTSLDENEIIRIYGKRWDIEVFFKVCKSYLNLSRECNSLSYDAMTAHTAVVFTRYMMLSLESRESNDSRSLGELFLYFSDEMSDITWLQALQMLLQMFRDILGDIIELSEEKIDELVDAFMDTLPVLLKTRLQAA